MLTEKPLKLVSMDQKEALNIIKNLENADPRFIDKVPYLTIFFINGCTKNEKDCNVVLKYKLSKSIDKPEIVEKSISIDDNGVITKHSCVLEKKYENVIGTTELSIQFVKKFKDELFNKKINFEKSLIENIRGAILYEGIKYLDRLKTYNIINFLTENPLNLTIKGFIRVGLAYFEDKEFILHDKIYLGLEDEYGDDKVIELAENKVIERAFPPAGIPEQDIEEKTIFGSPKFLKYFQSKVYWRC